MKLLNFQIEAVLTGNRKNMLSHFLEVVAKELKVLETLITQHLDKKVEAVDLKGVEAETIVVGKGIDFQFSYTFLNIKLAVNYLGQISKASLFDYPNFHFTSRSSVSFSLSLSSY